MGEPVVAKSNSCIIKSSEIVADMDLVILIPTVED
jgi:hypothetical protein